MTMQDIISKVQKLRRLATSSNVHEAAAAAAAADRLIQEHRLHESEIEAQAQAAGGAEEKPAEYEPLIVGSRKHTATWRFRLATSLARHYDVACYSDWRKNPFSGQVDRTLHLIGRKSDVETLRYQVAYFTIEIERLARTSGLRGRASLNSFRLGAVVGLVEAMHASKQAVMQEARADASASKQSAAIVLASRLGESRSIMDRLHPDLGKGRALPTNGSDYGAFAAGRRAGAGLYTGGQIASGGATRVLGSGGPGTGKVTP